MSKRKVNWKKKAWVEFSRYIRLRDCLETVGTHDHGKCITCGETFEFKKLQCGHAIPGRGNSILLDDTLTAAQCVRCNIWLNGQHGVFALRIIDKYGRKYYEQALIRAKQPKPMKPFEWEAEYHKWKEKTDR